MAGKAPTIIPGTRYGSLELTGGYIPRYMEGNKRIYATVECKCDCGKISYKQLQCLKNGGTKTCGYKCQFRNNKQALKHGLSFDENGKIQKEYGAWTGMNYRCHNPKAPNYKDYGGRGIFVHPEWRDSPVAFIEYIGKAPSPKHSVDRIDNDKGYEPGNVKWATKKEQNNNQRKKITNHSYDYLMQQIDFLKQLLRDNNVEYAAA